MSSSRLFVKNRYVLWGLVFLLFTLLALLNFARFTGNELAIGKPGRYTFYLIMETTGAYTVFLLLPAVLWFIRKYPITKTHLKSRIPMHIAASVVFGVSHTMLMYGSRVAIF